MATSKLVAPHGGGDLKPLLLEGDELKAELTEVESLPGVEMTSRETSDCVMLALDAFTPLEGFMGKAYRQGVCNKIDDGEEVEFKLHGAVTGDVKNNEVN